jgi:hypothetical protein
VLHSDVLGKSTSFLTARGGQMRCVITVFIRW